MNNNTIISIIVNTVTSSSFYTNSPTSSFHFLNKTNQQIIDLNNSDINSLNNSTNTSVILLDIHDKIYSLIVRLNIGTMLFGIIGNLICICVLSQKPLLKRRFNWLE